MLIFGSVDPLNECNLSFLYRIILWTCQSFEPPSSTPERDIHMRSPTSLDEIQFRTAFILTFFHVIRIFGSVQPYIEWILSFLHTIIFQPYQPFEPPSSTAGGDRHMHSWTFLNEIQFRTTFILSFFPCDACFWHRSWLFENFCMGYIW